MFKNKLGGEITKVTRTEQQIIRNSHPMWKIIDEMCFNSKNLYNYANYIIRQEYIENKRLNARDGPSKYYS